MRRYGPWMAGGLVMGLTVSLFFWHIFNYHLQPYLTGGKAAIDQNIVAAIVETSINNPEVQTILKKQIVLYLRSPEGRVKMAELMKSPEMLVVFAENLQSPELRPSILKLLEEPEFQNAVIKFIKETPEMRVLSVISSAVVFEHTDTAIPAQTE